METECLICGKRTEEFSGKLAELNRRRSNSSQQMDIENEEDNQNENDNEQDNNATSDEDEDEEEFDESQTSKIMRTKEGDKLFEQHVNQEHNHNSYFNCYCAIIKMEPVEMTATERYLRLVCTHEELDFSKLFPANQSVTLNNIDATSL